MGGWSDALDSAFKRIEYLSHDVNPNKMLYESNNLKFSNGICF